ncbi:hypothetical protein B9T16_26215 [Arthrospira sp. PCC 8006]|uniref:hypothetical protein n=1 Tax=Oscillatoriales TaxID=1150 RepID=UPI00396F06CE
MYQVQYLLSRFNLKPYPNDDNRNLLNPITMPSYSDITHNLVLAQENNSVNRMITQSASSYGPKGSRLPQLQFKTVLASFPAHCS